MDAANKVVFGSPEANRIAQRSKLLGRCTRIRCPQCHGGWLRPDGGCTRCNGQGYIFEHPEMGFYRLEADEVWFEMEEGR